MKILDILGRDDNVIAYRPELNKITGSVNATILFQQIIFNWKRSKGNSFYKFKKPSKKNSFYKEGDSWIEELGFTSREFDGAISKIAYRFVTKDEKIKKENDPSYVPPQSMIQYKRDSDGRTWYRLNEDLIEKRLQNLYNSLTVNQTTNSCLAKQQNRIWADADLLSGQTTNCNLPYTENTTENTTEKKVNQKGLPIPLSEKPKSSNVELPTSINEEISKSKNIENSGDYIPKQNRGLESLVKLLTKKKSIKYKIDIIKIIDKFNDVMDEFEKDDEMIKTIGRYTYGNKSINELILKRLKEYSLSDLLFFVERRSIYFGKDFVQYGNLKLQTLFTENSLSKYLSTEKENYQRQLIIENKKKKEELAEITKSNLSPEREASYQNYIKVISEKRPNLTKKNNFLTREDFNDWKDYYERKGSYTKVNSIHPTHLKRIFNGFHTEVNAYNVFIPEGMTFYKYMRHQITQKANRNFDKIHSSLKTHFGISY